MLDISLQSKITFLESIDYFQSFSKNELTIIATMLQDTFYKKGEVIFNENDTGDQLFFVFSGKLLLKIRNRSTNRFLPGDIFGEIAIIDKQIRSGSVIAIEDSVLLRVEGEELLRENTLSDKTKLQIYRELSRRVINYLFAKNDQLEKVIDKLIDQIDKRKKAEKELRIAKDRAEEINRLKSIFLSNISHELRAPMSGILGFIQMLKLELVEAEQIEMADKIEHSGKRLANTLHALLDLSLLETDSFPISITKINITEHVQSVVAKYKNQIASKDLNIEVTGLDEEIEIEGDSRIISQILGHLMDNAVKFTDKGYIKISVSFEDYFVVTFEDSGIGIAKENQTLIFDEFKQVSEGLQRAYEGSGLGLTITKKMVELMDGNISLRSEPEKGSVFKVSLPIEYDSDRQE